MGRLTAYLGPLKETYWVALGQALAFLGGLAGIKILTNIMPPENYGELALGLSLAGMANLFMFGPLGQVVLRYYSVCRERGNLAGYARVLIRLHRRAIVFLAALSLPFMVIVDMGFGRNWAWLFGLALLFGIISGVQGTLFSLLSALRDRKMGAFTQGLDTWLRLGFAIVLVTWIGSAGQWALLGFALGSLVVLTIQLRAVKRHGFHSARLSKGEIQDSDLRAEFFAYGLPFLAFAGLASISQYADRWLLQSFWSAGEVGIYAAMFQIASAPIVFLMGVATQLIIPVMFSRSGNLQSKTHTQSSQSLLNRSVMVVGGLYMVVTLVAYLWGNSIINWLTSADFSLYPSSLWLIVLSQALFNLAQFMVASGLSLNRPMAYFAPKLGQAVTLLVAGALLVRVGGIEGMAQALFVSSAVYFIWVVVVNMGLWRRHVAANTQLG